MQQSQLVELLLSKTKDLGKNPKQTSNKQKTLHKNKTKQQQQKYPTPKHETDKLGRTEI